MKKNKVFKVTGCLLSLLAICFSQIYEIPKFNLKAASFYELPSSVSYVEDFLCMKVGDSIDVTLSDGVFVVSSDTNILRVNSSGRIRAVGYGRAKIDFFKDSVTESLDIIVKKNYDSNVLTQSNSFPREYNGQNDMYIYRSDNGDIENDLANGLASLSLYGAPNNEGSYWNNISFIGADHFGGRGSGAISYKAVYPGNYTVDYSAWLLSSIRINNDYMSWNVDGFTTGLAKKANDGTIEILVSNIGNKESVVADESRYHMGTYTLDLASGEEVMMFFCSNGNGDCDEVFTEFAVTPNTITGDPLYVLPSQINRFESYPLLKIGETLDISPREGCSVVSSDSDIIEIVDNKLVAKALGNATITISDSNETVSFVVFTEKQYEGSYISLSNSIPAKQGDNNLYIYTTEDKDINTALSSLQLMDNQYSSATSWWDNKVFVNNERVYCNGTGAISFKAPIDGNYTVDFTSWLKSDVRIPQYLEGNADGYTSGLAKKSKDGTISILTSTIGTKESVLDIDTMRHNGSVTIDLLKDEEIMFFFNSNQTGDADEIMATFVVKNNVGTIYDGSLSFANGIAKYSDVGLLYIGETTKLLTSYQGKLNYSSSNENVAIIDENGKVTAKGVGVTVLKAYDAFVSKQLVLAVKSKNENEIIFSQSNLPSSQGVNNSHIYYHENGDIENNIAEGLKNVRLLDNKYYNSSEKSWWDADNRVVFINPYRVFTSGVGMLSYTVEQTGNYRMDYSAYLLDELRNNPLYGTWTNVDGFTIGIGKKDVNGNITVVDSFVRQRTDLIVDETRFSMNECVVNANKGDELFFFWISNGNGDCDEIVTDFTIQRVYLEGENKPVEIKLSADDVNIQVDEEIIINAALENYNGEEKIWSSSNEDVAVVDQNGKVTAVSSGVCEIKLTIGDEEEIIRIYVNYSLEYTQNSDDVLSIEFDNEYGELFIYRILLNGTTISSKSYSFENNVLSFSNEYLNGLEVGEKNIELITDSGKYEIDLMINAPEVEEPGNNPNEDPKEDPKEEPKPNNSSLIIGLSLGGASLIALIAVVFILLKKKKGV